jgi:hypothetical protein
MAMNRPMLAAMTTTNASALYGMAVTPFRRQARLLAIDLTYHPIISKRRSLVPCSGM